MSSRSSSKNEDTPSIKPSSKSPPLTITTSRSTSSVTGFTLEHINILPDGRIIPKPALEGFRQRLSQPRASLSSSRGPDSKFEDFQQKSVDVINEGEVMRDLVPIIAGKSSILNKQNLPFIGLDSRTHGTTVDCQADFYNGARLLDISKQVRDDLGRFIIPTRHRAAPAALDFLLEVKGRKGDAEVLEWQACYNGDLGARAMNELQSYRQKPTYDSDVCAITSTYHAGTSTL